MAGTDSGGGAFEGSPISVVSLGVSYGKGDDVIAAVESFSAEVAAGEYVSIIGPSGCGKSTFLKAVGGLVDVSTGSISVGGMTPAEARISRLFGFVFQEPVLLAWRTNLENVLLPLEVMGVGRGRRRERGMRSLEQVGLSAFAERYPRHLSGGMRQRVSIARALNLEPRILLMDEPFGALDELTRVAMNVELQRLWLETGKTVLFVTHSIREAVFLSDRVFVMSDRPGTLKAVVDINIPRPRNAADRESAEYSVYASELSAHLGL